MSAEEGRGDSTETKHSTSNKTEHGGKTAAVLDNSNETRRNINPKAEHGGKTTTVLDNSNETRRDINTKAESGSNIEADHNYNTRAENSNTT